MVIRSDKIGQSWLLPPSVSALLPVDHICYLVIAIVNSIDVSEIEKKYRFKVQTRQSCISTEDAASTVGRQ